MPGMSLNLKLSLFIGLTFAVMMAVIGHINIQSERQLLTKEMEHTSLRLARMFAILVSDALLKQDIDTINKYAEKASHEHISYLMVQDADNRVIVSTDSAQVGTILTDEISAMANQTAEELLQRSGHFIEFLQEIPLMFDVTVPIFKDNKKIGLIRIGISTREMRKKILQSRNAGITMVLISVAIGAGVISFLSWKVTKALTLLTTSTRRMAGGDLKQRVDIKTSDELEDLAIAFNQMAESLERRTEEKESYLRELQETKDYLSNILENSPDMIITTDLDTKIIEYNKGAERMLGYKREEVIGRSVENFYPDREVRRRLMKEVNSKGGVSNYETTLKTKDGRTIDITLTLSQLKDNQGNVIGTVGISKDITRQKRAERRIRHMTEGEKSIS
ncbi:MAG: PAS domain S-box protein [Nitrospinota bacterium]